jgi:hemerythrin
MPLNFEWDESYSVEDKELDGQHRNLFAFANSLPESMDKVAIQRAILTMVKHARIHFETEERMMAEIGYPGLPAHREMHNQLITSLNEVCEQPLNSEDSAYRFKKLLYDWITDHILHQDMGYVRFVRERRRAA